MTRLIYNSLGDLLCYAMVERSWRRELLDLLDMLWLCFVETTREVNTIGLE